MRVFARALGGVVSVPLSVGSPRLRVTKRPALWSSDFPRRGFSPPRPSGLLKQLLYHFFHNGELTMKSGMGKDKRQRMKERGEKENRSYRTYRRDSAGETFAPQGRLCGSAVLDGAGWKTRLSAGAYFWELRGNEKRNTPYNCQGASRQVILFRTGYFSRSCFLLLSG